MQAGSPVGAQQRLAEILAAAKLADESGLDVFAVGEHHRLDMAISATPVVLAAIAAVTESIRLASAVTILSTADPVRVFEDFATVDLISGGRAEIIAGRGIFTESFPLFGYDLADYDALFAEKLELLMKLNAAERVTWHGRFRSALNDAPIPPRPAQPTADLGRHRRHAGERRTRRHARLAARARQYQRAAGEARAARRPLPRTATHAGHDAKTLKISIATHMHIQENLQAALDTFYPHYAGYFARTQRHNIVRKKSRAPITMSAPPARRHLRRQPAADHRQDPLRARIVRPRPFHGADRHRRLAVCGRRAGDRIVRRQSRAGRRGAVGK